MPASPDDAAANTTYTVWPYEFGFANAAKCRQRLCGVVLVLRFGLWGGVVSWSGTGLLGAAEKPTLRVGFWVFLPAIT